MSVTDIEKMPITEKCDVCGRDCLSMSLIRTIFYRGTSRPRVVVRHHAECNPQPYFERIFSESPMED